MANQKIVRCWRCRVTEQVHKVDGAMPDLPDGWAVLTLAVRPVVNRVLCPRHVKTVTLWLAGLVTLEAEQLSLADVPPF